MIRVAAAGDIHLGAGSSGSYRSRLGRLGEQADVFVLAGDLTNRGTAEEADAVARELAGLPVPTFAVLGNHDFESGCPALLTSRLEAAGVCVLEGTAATYDLGGCRLGIAGVKGFGGGFPGRCGSEFGEPEMKAFIRHTRETADKLAGALESLGDADLRIAVTHYAPVEATLAGERCEIYPFLGSYLLAEAIDGGGAALALHGHAHGGSPAGVTPGGTPVRNVALPVIRRSYRVFCLEEATVGEAPSSGDLLGGEASSDVRVVQAPFT